MAALWFCKPVTGSTGTDRTGSIFKDDRKNRMDSLHPNVCHAGSYLYCTHPEDDRTGRQYGKWPGNLTGRRIAVYRSSPLNGTGGYGSI